LIYRAPPTDAPPAYAPGHRQSVRTAVGPTCGTLFRNCRFRAKRPFALPFFTYILQSFDGLKAFRAEKVSICHFRERNPPLS